MIITTIGSPDSPSKRTTHHTAVGSSHNESDSMHSSVHSNTTLTQRAGGGATSARLRPASMSRKSAKMGGGMYFGKYKAANINVITAVEDFEMSKIAVLV